MRAVELSSPVRVRRTTPWGIVRFTAWGNKHARTQHLFVLMTRAIRAIFFAKETLHVMTQRFRIAPVIRLCAQLRALKVKKFVEGWSPNPLSLSVSKKKFFLMTNNCVGSVDVGVFAERERDRKPQKTSAGIC